MTNSEVFGRVVKKMKVLYKVLYKDKLCWHVEFSKSQNNVTLERVEGLVNRKRNRGRRKDRLVDNIQMRYQEARGPGQGSISCRTCLWADDGITSRTEDTR